MNLIHLLRKPGTLGMILMGLSTVLVPHVSAAGICLTTGFYGPASLASEAGIAACGNAAGLVIQPFPGTTVTTIPPVLPSPISLLTTGQLLNSDSRADHARAFASLNLGTLGDYAGSTATGRTLASSILLDSVHFTITDGAPFVPIFVHIHLGGTLSGAGFYSNQFGLFFGGVLDYTMQNGAFVAAQQGWVNPSLTHESLGGFDFRGVLDVTNGESLPLLMSLSLDCNTGEVCDYSHTAQLSFGLPSDVTFTSDSGVLLKGTSSVPEPSSLLLMLPGLLGLGWVRRMRLRQREARGHGLA